MTSAPAPIPPTIAGASDSSGTYASGTVPMMGGSGLFTPVAVLPLTGGTLTGALTAGGQANFGGASGHSYFDANGDQQVRSGQSYLFKYPDGSTAISIAANAAVNIPALRASTFQIQTLSTSNTPLNLYPSNNQPINLGDSTSVPTNVLGRATFANTIQPVALNTSTTPGTVTNQVAISSATGKLVVWNNTAMTWSAAV